MKKCINNKNLNSLNSNNNQLNSFKPKSKKINKSNFSNINCIISKKPSKNIFKKWSINKPCMACFNKKSNKSSFMKPWCRKNKNNKGKLNKKNNNLEKSKKKNKRPDYCKNKDKQLWTPLNTEKWWQLREDGKNKKEDRLNK